MVILLDNNEYSFDHIGLRKWLELEEIRETFIKAADSGNIDNIVLSICSYISAALGISTDGLEQLPWYELATAYIVIASMCIPKLDLAILKGEASNKEEVSWDYDGRTFFLWAHLIASYYGWTLEYIADLSFNDALAFIQEILVDDQLKKEWEWSLSEIAYPYNPSAKRSEFKPLSRPSWMVESILVKPIRITKIPKNMIPVGIVVRLGEKHEAPPN